MKGVLICMPEKQFLETKLTIQGIYSSTVYIKIKLHVKFNFWTSLRLCLIWKKMKDRKNKSGRKIIFVVWLWEKFFVVWSWVKVRRKIKEKKINENIKHNFLFIFLSSNVVKSEGKCIEEEERCLELLIRHSQTIQTL